VRILTLPGVFRPRSDTWMLAAAVREESQPGARMLELCTGSGAVAVAAARAGAHATAVDVSRRAVLTARANARLNGVRVRALRGDLLAPVAGERFDLIAANPPYLPARDDALPTRGRARHTEAGRDGRALLDRILAAAPAHLAPGGALLLVHTSLIGEDRTLEAMRAAGLEAGVVLRHRGPLGPLLAARAPALEARGLLAPGRRTEDVLVLRGRAPRARFAPSPAPARAATAGSS